MFAAWALFTILTLLEICCYFPTNFGMFLSQITYPYYILKVKHKDGYVNKYIDCLVIYIQICGCCKISVVIHDTLESFLWYRCLNCAPQLNYNG